MKTKMILCLMLAAAAAPAHAGYTLYTGEPGNFLPDTATNAYLAAQGTPTEFISFNTLADGMTTAVGNPIDGSLFSNNVSFASANGPLVNFSGAGDDSEIGPADQGFYDGTLLITLASPASAVGFGPVNPTSITFFGTDGGVIQTYDSASDFGFVGLVGDSGSLIKSVALTGTFFAIQDFQYKLSASAVPEPASWALMIGGIGVAGMAMRRKQRVSVTYA